MTETLVWQTNPYFDTVDISNADIISQIQNTQNVLCRDIHQLYNGIFSYTFDVESGKDISDIRKKIDSIKLHRLQLPVSKSDDISSIKSIMSALIQKYLKVPMVSFNISTADTFQILEPMTNISINGKTTPIYVSTDELSRYTALLDPKHYANKKLLSADPLVWYADKKFRENGVVPDVELTSWQGLALIDSKYVGSFLQMYDDAVKSLHLEGYIFLQTSAMDKDILREMSDFWHTEVVQTFDNASKDVIILHSKLHFPASWYIDAVYRIKSGKLPVCTIPGKKVDTEDIPKYKYAVYRAYMDIFLNNQNPVLKSLLMEVKINIDASITAYFAAYGDIEDFEKYLSYYTSLLTTYVSIPVKSLEDGVVLRSKLEGSKSLIVRDFENRHYVVCEDCEDIPEIYDEDKAILAKAITLNLNLSDMDLETALQYNRVRNTVFHVPDVLQNPEKYLNEDIIFAAKNHEHGLCGFFRIGVLSGLFEYPVYSPLVEAPAGLILHEKNGEVYDVYFKQPNNLVRFMFSIHANDIAKIETEVQRLWNMGWFFNLWCSYLSYKKNELSVNVLRSIEVLQTAGKDRDAGTLATLFLENAP